MFLVVSRHVAKWLSNRLLGFRSGYSTMIFNNPTASYSVCINYEKGRRVRTSNTNTSEFSQNNLLNLVEFDPDFSHIEETFSIN